MAAKESFEAYTMETIEKILELCDNTTAIVTALDTRLKRLERAIPLKTRKTTIRNSKPPSSPLRKDDHETELARQYGFDKSPATAPYTKHEFGTFVHTFYSEFQQAVIRHKITRDLVVLTNVPLRFDALDVYMQKRASITLQQRWNRYREKHATHCAEVELHEQQWRQSGFNEQIEHPGVDLIDPRAMKRWRKKLLAGLPEDRSLVVQDMLNYMQGLQMDAYLCKGNEL